MSHLLWCQMPARINVPEDPESKFIVDFYYDERCSSSYELIALQTPSSKSMYGLKQVPYSQTFDACFAFLPLR